MSRRHPSPILPTKFFEQAETDYGLPMSQRWLLTARPFLDESLASWYARQADAMGSDSRQLANLIANELGKSPEILCRDFDVAAADDTVLNQLAARAGVPESVMFRMATHRLLGNELSSRKLVKNWLMRRPHAAKLLPATHICPECLVADNTPYLRQNQEAAPFHFKVAYRRLIALPGIVARGGADVLVELAHQTLLWLLSRGLQGESPQKCDFLHMIPDKNTLSSFILRANTDCISI